jgi:hypothetical protein
MGKLRKKWSTVRGPHPVNITPDDGTIWPTEHAAYACVGLDGAHYAAGLHDYSHTDVFVDEREGWGWQLFETVEHTRKDGS